MVSSNAYWSRYLILIKNHYTSQIKKKQGFEIFQHLAVCLLFIMRIVLWILLKCSSHRFISFRESMPLPRESVTHWPINWQSALIPSSSQELFFLVPSFCVSTVKEPWASSTNRSLSHDCYWFHLEFVTEENAAASFAHASYKPKTNILTSDNEGILSHSHSLMPATIINLSLLCCLKEFSWFICVAK